MTLKIYMYVMIKNLDQILDRTFFPNFNDLKDIYVCISLRSSYFSFATID